MQATVGMKWLGQKGLKIVIVCLLLVGTNFCCSPFTFAVDQSSNFQKGAHSSFSQSQYQNQNQNRSSTSATAPMGANVASPSLGGCNPVQQYDLCVNRVIVYDGSIDWVDAFYKSSDGGLEVPPPPILAPLNGVKQETSAAVATCRIEITSMDQGKLLKDLVYFASSELVCHELLRVKEAGRLLRGGKDIFFKPLYINGDFKAYKVNFIVE